MINAARLWRPRAPRTLQSIVQCVRGGNSAVPATNAQCWHHTTASRLSPDASGKKKDEASNSGIAQDKGRKPRIDFKRMISNKEAVVENIANRGVKGVDVAAIEELYTKNLRESQRLDALRHERNVIAKEIEQLRGQHPERRAQLIERGRAVKEEISALQDAFSGSESSLLEHGLRVPNDSSPHSPIGEEANARLLYETPVDERPRLDCEPKDHVQLGSLLGIIDVETAARASGAGFYYLKGAAALLEYALVGYALHSAVARGYVPVITPDVSRMSVAEGCGYRPREGGSNNQTFALGGAYSNLCLVGTAEIPIAALHMSQVMDDADLPRKYVGLSHCFRAEAGHHGTETKGIYRVHQFTKVELFAFTKSNTAESEQALAEIVAFQTDLFSVLEMPTMELGASAYRKIDIEAWMPGRNKYGEISSASNCTDYQSRRLEIRHRSSDAKGKAEVHLAEHGSTSSRFVHTINGTAAAIPRLIVAILENFQRPDGSVVIPEPLRAYMGGKDVIFVPALEAAASGHVGSRIEI